MNSGAHDSAYGNEMSSSLIQTVLSVLDSHQINGHGPVTDLFRSSLISCSDITVGRESLRLSAENHPAPKNCYFVYAVHYNHFFSYCQALKSV